jgi:general secretion pathway protein D
MVMTTFERSCRLRRRLIAAPALALAMAAAAPASAQPAPPRGGPVLRTPGQKAEPPTTPPARPGPPVGAPPAGAPPAGAPPEDGGDDPLSSVKQGVKEIEFKPKPGGYKVSFNLDEADLPELVKAISNITGRRFIYGGKLRQIKATVYAPEKVTVAEAYSAFLSILAANDLTVIPHGRFLKIVETPGAVTETTPIYGTAAPVPAEDRFVTRMYRLNHIDANDAGSVLNKFKSKDGDITVYPQGNLLIVTDTGSNIDRMLRIVEEIDTGGAGDQLWVQPVHYGSAAEVATKLNEIVDPSKSGGGKGGKGAAGGARIIADDRTNSLVITASEPDYLRVLGILKRLDVPQTGEGQIHVLPLQHAGCKELSATLNQILGGGGGGAAGGKTPGRSAPPTPGSTEEIFEGQVKVTCDEASNKLVVTSSLRDYAQLRSVIDELDMPRRQVFIEAVIMDVNVNRTLDLGVAYHLGAPFDTSEGQAVAYGGNKILTSLAGLPDQNKLGALALGVRGPDIEGTNNILGTGVSIPGFGVVLHALATDGDSNVLATPHILATDNVPAEISIGQNIPLQTNVGGGNLGSLASLAGGQAAGAAGALGGLLGGLGGGFSAPRQDVGTKIKVVPHVNDSDQVRLELTEEISDAGAALEGALGAIPINKRTANTTLIVRDQQTVVIGGLVRDAVTNSRTKVPILGDIPVLGFLFRQSVKTKTKTNLLLILTPYVIRDQEDLRAIFERKMQERQEFLDRYFVFNDSAAWEPPRDFTRANGLVEEIRQAMIKEDERARLEEESRPRGPKEHTPVEPVGLPTFGAKTGTTVPGAMMESDGEIAPSPPGGFTPPTRPKLRAPGARPVERIE